MNTTSISARHSLGDTITRWWHRFTRNWAGSWELDRLDKTELRQIATDVNSDVSELRTLAGRWPESADLLPRRLSALHLEAQTLFKEQPLLANDLQKHCSLCLTKGQCKHDLDKRPDDPAWQSYCPNTMTLMAVSKARAEARNSVKPQENGL